MCWELSIAATCGMDATGDRLSIAVLIKVVQKTMPWLWDDTPLQECRLSLLFRARRLDRRAPHDKGHISALRLQFLGGVWHLARDVGDKDCSVETFRRAADAYCDKQCSCEAHSGRPPSQLSTRRSERIPGRWVAEGRSERANTNVANHFPTWARLSQTPARASKQTCITLTPISEAPLTPANLSTGMRSVEHGWRPPEWRARALSHLI